MFLVVAAGCNRPVANSQDHTAEPYIADSGSVGFDIESLQTANGSLHLIGTYTSQSRTAKFTIELDPAKTLKADSKDVPINVGRGRFVAESGSDSRGLLTDLMKALEAKKLPTTVARLHSLPFTFVNVGDNLSQASGGGFNSEPPGNWTAMKIFIGQGEREGQLFVNLNPATRKGQFSIKDPEYGDLLIAGLAKVL